MSEPNWGMIRSGECFEALVHALVFADDHEAKLMDRPGKDKGVDALSGDGRTVFQAKFGLNMTMEDAISRAKDEMTGIKRHRENNDPTWRIVENWVLYANIGINTWDAEKWKSFAQNFKKETGLGAECHNIALINQQLVDHPEIEQVFFEGRNRCLLYAKETYKTLEQQSFLSCFHKTKFIGRDAEVRQIAMELDNPKTRIIVVNGRSGVGRTRFLYELFIRQSMSSVRSYWGRVDSMIQSDSWFRSLNLGQRAIVFVDDCNEKILGLILDQLHATGLDQIQYVVSCPDEYLCKVNPRLRRIDCAVKIELQRLSNDDMGEVVRSYEGADSLSLEKIGGICHMAGGYPGWATFILSAKFRHNHAQLMDVAWDVTERALKGIPDRFQAAAQTLLRWVSLWGKVDFDGSEEKERIIALLETSGLPRGDLEDVIRHLCAVGLMTRSKLRGCVCRIANRIIQHEVLLRWLIDIDTYASGGGLRLTGNGKKLIDVITSGNLPLFSQALEVLASVSVAHLPSGDAKTFATPILRDIADKITSTSSISSLDEAYAFEVVWNIGVCDPMNALGILKSIKNTQSTDSEIDNVTFGRWTLTHAQVCSRVPALVKNIAENLEDDAIGKEYFLFLLDLWNDKETNGTEFEDGADPEKAIETMITSSEQNARYHRIAFKFIKSKLADIPTSQHLQKILSFLFVLRLSRAFVHMNYNFVMEHAYATPGTEPWAHWIELRQAVIDAVTNEADTLRRRVWWQMLANAHRNLLNLADNPDKLCKADELADVYNKTLKEDISIVLDYLTENEGRIPFEERVVMRHIWEFSIERAAFNVPDEMYALAVACERLYANGTEYNIQEIYKSESITHDDAAENAIDNVIELFLNPPDADFYYHFFEAATDYLKAVNSDPDVDYGRTTEIAIALHEKTATKYRAGDGSPIDEYVTKVLADYSNAHILTRKFVATTLRLYVKDLKIENDVVSGFRQAWDSLVKLSLTEDNLCTIAADIYCKAHPNATGTFCAEELEKLLSLKMDVNALCNIIPAYYGVDEGPVLEGLETAIRDCNESSDISTVSRIMIHRFYVAAIQETITPNKKLMDWLMDFIIFGKIPVDNIYSHQFGSLVELSKYIYPVKTLEKFFEAGFNFEHGFEIAKYFEVGDDAQTYYALCEWVLADGPDAFLRHYSLPQYLVALDGEEHRLDGFIRSKCNEFTGQQKQLRRLALFAGCYKNDTDEWSAIATQVCKAASTLSDQDKISIYNALNPKIFMWHGVRGKVSQDIISRLEIAKEHCAKESEDSPLRGYWEFELSLAEGEYKRALAEIEEEENE